MNIENPYLPLALTWVLANQTPVRRGLARGQNFLHCVIQKGASSSMFGLPLVDDSSWTSFIGQIMQATTNQAPDTVTLLYSTTPQDNAKDTELSDFGVVIKAGQPLFFISWTYHPEFQIAMLTDKAQIENLSNGGGVKEVQNILEMQAKIAGLPVPFMNVRARVDVKTPANAEDAQ